VDDTPPPKVDAPSQEEWDLDPGKAGEKYRQHLDWKNYQDLKPIKDRLAAQDQAADAESMADFQRKSAEVRHAWQLTQTAVKNFYDESSIFNRDEEFRTNPKLQETVEEMLDYCIARAYDKADATGDASQLMNIATDPKFQHRLLHSAKGELEYPDRAMRPNATPVGPQGPDVVRDEVLDDADRAALKEAQKEGYGYTAEQLREAKKITGGA
jgi:hypothetical protein